MGVAESDAQVVASSLEHPPRFAVLYERHLDRVAGYLARRVGREQAEDMTAEVFVRAFRARQRFRPERDSALPWLLGIASHLIADHRRAERRRLAALQRLAIATPDASPDDHPGLAPDTVRRLRRLPTADRDALLLVVWGELSYAEAAEALGVPVGTVRSRIARARERLARAIGDETAHPDGHRSASPVEEGEMNV
jgi:RNA polymerase sigma-70 factor (ECF subfamily)